MLKKIPISKVRVGMYLHSLEGSWLSHSLWKTRFLIEAESELQKLRESGAAEVWIDESRGDDANGNPTMRIKTLPASAQMPPRPASRPTSMADELQNARDIRSRAKVVVTSMFQQARMGNTFDAELCAPLVADVVDSVHRNNDALVSLSRLKLADEYTYLHSVTVCALMVSLGKQLGFDRQECHEAGMAGLMHDLGKAAMPLELINKPGSLTDSEFDIIRQHPQRGHEMLLRAGVTSEGVLSVCLHHHERLDGKGYPDKQPAERISLLVRMSAVCDVYDAITSNRPYKPGWDPAESISRMASWKGHFDEEVLRAFIKSLGIYPTGSLVRLQSGRLAVVVAQNPDKLTAPKVKVFFCTTTYKQLTPEVLDLHAPSCSERIVGREPPEKWSFANLEKLWLERPRMSDDRHRLDKWLWHTRFFKTRSLATAAVNGGKVKVHGERVKPAHRVHIGERMSVSIGEHAIDLDVISLPDRRGAAPEAQACYRETPESVLRTQSYREQSRLSAMTRPRPDSRPDKRERRQLDRLRRQQG